MDANDFFHFSSGVHGPTVVLGRLYLRPLHVKIMDFLKNSLHLNKGYEKTANG